MVAQPLDKGECWLARGLWYCPDSLRGCSPEASSEDLRRLQQRPGEADAEGLELRICGSVFFRWYSLNPGHCRAPPKGAGERQLDKEFPSRFVKCVLMNLQTSRAAVHPLRDGGCRDVCRLRGWYSRLKHFAGLCRISSSVSSLASPKLAIPGSQPLGRCAALDVCTTVHLLSDVCRHGNQWSSALPSRTGFELNRERR